MSPWQAFFLGILVAYTPSLLMLAVLLWRTMEDELNREDNL